MLTLTITITAKNTSLLEDGVNRVAELVSQGYTSGSDGGPNSNFYFDVSGDEEEEETEEYDVHTDPDAPRIGDPIFQNVYTIALPSPYTHIVEVLGMHGEQPNDGVYHVRDDDEDFLVVYNESAWEIIAHLTTE